jgi:hypothetical protein
MQHNQVRQEEQYADGLGEYSSFYGGPSYNYLAPAKMAASTVQELPASQPAITGQSRQSAATSLQHAISYDLAANVPEVRSEAEGLQVTYEQPNHGFPATSYAIEPGYAKEAEGPQLAYNQHPASGLLSQHTPENMMDSRHNRHAQMGYAPRSAVPAPLNYGQKQYGGGSYLQQFPQPPTSPTSPTSQQHLHPAYRRPIQYHQQHQPPTVPSVPSVPMPLKFQPSNMMPPTPPQSTGARTNEDALRDSMHSMNMGDTSPVLGKYSTGRPKFPPGTLGR